MPLDFLNKLLRINLKDMFNEQFMYTHKHTQVHVLAVLFLYF